jgi:hypothetical protein
MKYPKEVLKVVLEDQNYIEKQLFKVASLPLTEENYPDGFDIMIREWDKSTKWLAITADQLRKIEAVLRFNPKWLDVTPEQMKKIEAGMRGD